MAIRSFALLLCGALTFAPANAATVEEEVRAHLDRIRAIKAGKADDKTIGEYNRQMDAAWKYFSGNQKAVVPVLRKELAAEIDKPKRSDLVLLDIGYFLAGQGEPSDRALGTKALLALDPSAGIIRQNQQELFEFVHLLARSPDRDPRLLGAIANGFLREEVSLFIPQHSLELDGTLACAFLYGVYGEGAEAHLRGFLAEPKLAKRVLEILGWIGSPESNQAVKAAMQSGRDYESFARATAFLMTQGGPEGRGIMLEVKPETLDAKAQEYYGRIRGDIESVSYERLKKQFAGMPGDSALDGEKLKGRLAEMYANYGKDDRTSPAAIVNSSLPASFLVGELTRTRSRMFHRISDEALSDVRMTNALLNTLRYRPQ